MYAHTITTYTRYFKVARELILNIYLIVSLTIIIIIFYYYLFSYFCAISLYVSFNPIARCLFAFLTYSLVTCETKNRIQVNCNIHQRYWRFSCMQIYYFYETISISINIINKKKERKERKETTPMKINQGARTRKKRFFLKKFRFERKYISI